MIFSIAIYSSPSTQSSHSAYQFAQAAIAQGHRVYRIFFYHDAVYQSSSLLTPPQDEVNKATQWQLFAKEHDIELIVCIAAGLRRGIIDEKESTRYATTAHNLADSFELSGLGQLVDAAVHSERLITFGH